MSEVFDREDRSSEVFDQERLAWKRKAPIAWKVPECRF